MVPKWNLSKIISTLCSVCLFLGPIIFIADYTDTLRKREEFAISLRKQKTKEIIQQKRKKIMEDLAKSDNLTRTMLKTDSMYNGYLPFKKLDTDHLIREVAPDMFNATTIVSAVKKRSSLILGSQSLGTDWRVAIYCAERTELSALACMCGTNSPVVIELSR